MVGGKCYFICQQTVIVLFVCSSKAVLINEFAERIPSQVDDRRSVTTLDLHKLKAANPQWTHILLRTLKTYKPVCIYNILTLTLLVIIFIFWRYVSSYLTSTFTAKNAICKCECPNGTPTPFSILSTKLLREARLCICSYPVRP